MGPKRLADTVYEPQMNYKFTPSTLIEPAPIGIGGHYPEGTTNIHSSD